MVNLNLILNNSLIMCIINANGFVVNCSLLFDMISLIVKYYQTFSAPGPISFVSDFRVRVLLASRNRRRCLLP